MRTLIPTVLYNLLIRTSWLNRRRWTSWLWKPLWERSCRTFSGDVATTLHKRKVTVNFGYPYPFIARNIPALNNPLIELVHQRSSQLHRPLTIIDVGAGLGDSVLLLLSNCPACVGTLLCIEGEKDFFRLLQNNISSFPNVIPYFQVLSSSSTTAPDLVRRHAGTASAMGEQTIATTTLDSLRSSEHFGKIDLLKIDVDGYDGRVLEGARELISEDQPDIIFEWHPGLYTKTGNSIRSPFETLTTIGYLQFIFYTKFGEFSHFMNGLDGAAIELLGALALTSTVYDDWHYDVIALHPSSTTPPVALAEMLFARSKRVPY